MPYILVRHKVQDYAKWRPVYDQHDATRKSGGQQGHRVFRSADNPNEIVILLEWDTAAKARQFTQSPDLREAMERAGVTERPDIVFLNEA
jgi:heme-degrading monooxygenase HmoA